jgi:putative transposase
MNYNPAIHHRRSIRLKHYDYAKNGYYFITICSKDRDCIFGELNVGALLVCAQNMIALSNAGKIIDYHWLNIPNQYENAFLDEYIIMPNHIHGIIIIDKEKRAQASSAPTISQILRSFKSKSAIEYLKHIKDNNLNLSEKIWQRNYYERIIRNENELNKIRKYIIENPLKWEDDKYHPNILTRKRRGGFRTHSLPI